MDGSEVLRLLRGRKETAKLLRDRSLVEGLLNGNKRWLAIGALVWGSRALRKAFSVNEKVLLREVLQPGERLVIAELITKPSRKQRRAAKRES